jgi:hypothetical protein
VRLAALRREIARLKADIIPEPRVRVRPGIQLPGGPKWIEIPASEAVRPGLYIPNRDEKCAASELRPMQLYEGPDDDMEDDDDVA